MQQTSPEAAVRCALGVRDVLRQCHITSGGEFKAGPGGQESCTRAIAGAAVQCIEAVAPRRHNHPFGPGPVSPTASPFGHRASDLDPAAHFGVHGKLGPGAHQQPLFFPFESQTVPGSRYFNVGPGAPWHIDAADAPLQRLTTYSY